MEPKYQIGQKVIVKQAKSKLSSARDSDIRQYGGQNGIVTDYYWISPPGSKVFYIYNGKMNGGFIFPGMRAGDRDKAKPPKIIIADRLFQKEIYPGNLAQMSKMAGGTVYAPMKPGENGVKLTVKVGQKEITEELTVNLSKEAAK